MAGKTGAFSLLRSEAAGHLAFSTGSTSRARRHRTFGRQFPESSPSAGLFWDWPRKAFGVWRLAFGVHRSPFAGGEGSPSICRLFLLNDSLCVELRTEDLARLLGHNGSGLSRQSVDNRHPSRERAFADKWLD
jgi:hypothetical protein